MRGSPGYDTVIYASCIYQRTGLRYTKARVVSALPNSCRALRDSGATYVGVEPIRFAFRSSMHPSRVRETQGPILLAGPSTPMKPTG